MDKNKIANPMKNPNFLKEDIFLDYLIYNNNPLTNEDFIKPKLETFDKFFDEEESTQKLNISPNKLNSKISLPQNSPFNNFSNLPEKLKIINGAEEKNILENNTKMNNNLNNNNDINLGQNNLYECNCMKKHLLFNTIHDQNLNIEELKKRKLIMNRESAKKSRLKKKKYVENLEKEFIVLKEELIRIKSSKNINNSDKFINDLYSNNIIENFLKNEKKNNIDLNLNLNKKEKEIFELKREEMNIISNNLEKNPDKIKSFTNKQKNVLEYLLVKQIDSMTPIKIKNFQNKFLKLETFEIDDNINIIKNKIEKNINTLIELYDIDENNCKNNINKNNIIINKNKSISYQLYDFYNSLKAYVDQYYNIFNKIENI